MSISKTLSSLSIGLSHSNVRYLEARAARPELAPYPTAWDLARALAVKSSTTANQRFAIVAAVVEEHRARPDQVWTSILLVGFGTLLHSLRACVSRGRSEEDDQRVIAAFLQAVAALSPKAGLHATIALRRDAKRILFPRVEREEIEELPFEEESHSPEDSSAIAIAELRIDAFWAAKRAARLDAEREADRARVRRLPRSRRAAA
jgi:hypothetical protein